MGTDWYSTNENWKGRAFRGIQNCTCAAHLPSASDIPAILDFPIQSRCVSGECISHHAVHDGCVAIRNSACAICGLNLDICAVCLEIYSVGLGTLPTSFRATLAG